MKALFIPLKTEYYEMFECGDKTTERRIYGKRWNENVCSIGREVTLSKGYGKRSRISGSISDFSKVHGFDLNNADKHSIMSIYGTLDIWIACIGIRIKAQAAELRE